MENTEALTKTTLSLTLKMQTHAPGGIKNNTKVRTMA